MYMRHTHIDLCFNLDSNFEQGCGFRPKRDGLEQFCSQFHVAILFLKISIALLDSGKTSVTCSVHGI